jgi:hypothetical protein
MMKNFLIILALFAIPAAAEEYKEFSGPAGTINWSNGTISAVGHGVAREGANPKVAGLLACTAAKVVAQRNLLEATEGVRVTSETLVRDFAIASDTIRTTVEGLVKGAMMLERSEDDGVCKVVLRMAMGGDMSKTVYGASFDREEAALTQTRPYSLLDLLIPSAQAAEQVSMDSWTSSYQSLSDRLSAIEKRLSIIPDSTLVRQSDAQPTGLIVDARGSNFIPSLSPNIRQIKGGLIYPNNSAKSSILGDGKLVALFARGVDYAMGHPKVGERPLVVKGLRTWGDSRTEIVVGEQAAEKLQSLANTDFFSTAGVIIVLD